MEIVELRLDQLTLAKRRVRKAHSKSKLAQLKKSISATRGPLLPLVVRKTDDSSYEIISGDGRYQAMLDLEYPSDHKVPCLVVDMNEKEALEFGLVDNVVREQMSPYEEALVARMLVDDFGLKQSEVASKLGRDKAYISHLLATFQLAPEVVEAMRNKTIQFGHARALCSLRGDEGKQNEILGMIIDRKLSVNDTEAEVRNVRRGGQISSNPFEAMRPGTIWVSSTTRLTIKPRKDSVLVEILLSDKSEIEKIFGILREKLE